jgi:hypothetical protein
MLDEALHVSGFCATPAIDGLILVAYYADIFFWAGEQAD